jgi:hypothetical protein
VSDEMSKPQLYDIADDQSSVPLNQSDNNEEIGKKNILRHKSKNV